MVWRHSDAVLNEPEPSAVEINTRFLETLRECPSRVRPFPEPLLVLLGISKLWDKPDRDPVLMRDGQGMHLFCCAMMFLFSSDDTSDVVFEDVAAIPGEDAVARGLSIDSKVPVMWVFQTLRVLRKFMLPRFLPVGQTAV
ncbi:hypothetical protein HanPI659440_Chr03g0099541 [Helianthus annuus]|nr:hypothetical protein HanPI659440_Chr03g0099541 [Helianthus annuus]